MIATIRRGFLASVIALAAAGLVASALPVQAGEGYMGGKSTLLETVPAERVNVNTASIAELAKVQGIGEELARAIVSYRDENGPFSKIDDLLKVKGIGEMELFAFRDQVTLE